MYKTRSYNVIQNITGRVTDSEGEPLPGANIVVTGSTIGTVTGLDGNYSLTIPKDGKSISVYYVGFKTVELPIDSEIINIRMEEDMQSLQEVVVTGYGSLQGRVAGIRTREAEVVSKAETMTATTVENQTTVEFEIDKPYSISSNGDVLTVDLSNYEIEAQYEYFAVPKLDKDPFLTARIIDWSRLNLIEGEANLYFEDKFVGRTIINANALEDTLSISLGRDRSIVIARDKKEDFSQRQVIGANKIDSRSFIITVRNNKSVPVRLLLSDQVPVAAISDIQVNPTELSGGILDENTGKVIWRLQLDGGDQKELRLGYEVKYPKNEKVYLE